MEHTLTGITTAKQMRKLLKEQKKKRILAKKQRKANETVKPEVMQNIIEMLKDSDNLESRLVWLSCGNDEYEEITRDLYLNLHAYTKAFRKLGYRLSYCSDSSGSDFTISF